MIAISLSLSLNFHDFLGTRIFCNMLMHVEILIEFNIVEDLKKKKKPKNKCMVKINIFCQFLQTLFCSISETNQ